MMHPVYSFWAACCCVLKLVPTLCRRASRRVPGKLRMLASLEDYRRLVERLLQRPTVTLQDMIMCKGDEAHVSRLPPVKEQRLEMYRAIFPEAVVADLTQNPEARRRCGHADMPTLTRACTSLVHIPTGHIYGCVSAFSRV